MTLRRLLLVALGGTLGTAARLAVALLVPDAGGFPLSTLAVNVAGALLLGVLAARLPGSSDMRVFLGTGILGGFTTYSAFAVGTVQLWTATPLLAVLYPVLTLALGIAAAILGMRVGRRREAP
ncbi:fluoride efflux transporter FluC [Microbacterium sp. TWP3-1-2b2]|uniref:fluoride efflux transporter FluC n=1 Tax=Microbacterium sp. TWP3-1-2b2 TaxID=2804651 RepID=UPI003CF987A2